MQCYKALITRSTVIVLLLLFTISCSTHNTFNSQVTDVKNISIDGDIVVPILAEFTVSPVQQQILVEELRGYKVTYQRYDVTFETVLTPEELFTYFDREMLNVGWTSVCILRLTISDPPVERLPLDDQGACGVVLGGPFKEDFDAYRIYQMDDLYIHADLFIEAQQGRTLGKIQIFKVIEMIVP